MKVELDDNERRLCELAIEIYTQSNVVRLSDDDEIVLQAEALVEKLSDEYDELVVDVDVYSMLTKLKSN